MAGRNWVKGIREAAVKKAGDVTAGLATRALDAMQKVDTVRGTPKKVTAAAVARLGRVGDVAGKAMDVVERVPVAGKVAGATRRAVEKRLGLETRGPKKRRDEPMEARGTTPRAASATARAKAPPRDAREEEERHLPEPTDPELRLDEGRARVTTTSRGRKTVPLAVAAARKARAQKQGAVGFKPKKGQKKKIRH